MNFPESVLVCSTGRPYLEKHVVLQVRCRPPEGAVVARVGLPAFLA